MGHIVARHRPHLTPGLGFEHSCLSQKYNAMKLFSCSKYISDCIVERTYEKPLELPTYQVPAVISATKGSTNFGVVADKDCLFIIFSHSGGDCKASWILAALH